MVVKQHGIFITGLKLSRPRGEPSELLHRASHVLVSGMKDVLAQKFFHSFNSNNPESIIFAVCIVLID